MRLHPQMQRLGASLGEPRVVRARNCTNRVLQEPEFLIQWRVRRKNECAHDDVRVAVDVFSETVQDDVGPEEEGRGVEGGEEGVVDKEEGMRWVTVGYLGEARYVD